VRAQRRCCNLLPVSCSAGPNFWRRLVPTSELHCIGPGPFTNHRRQPPSSLSSLSYYSPPPLSACLAFHNRRSNCKKERNDVVHFGRHKAGEEGGGAAAVVLMVRLLLQSKGCSINGSSFTPVQDCLSMTRKRRKELSLPWSWPGLGQAPRKHHQRRWRRGTVLWSGKVFALRKMRSLRWWLRRRHWTRRSVSA
jgi:hypothetical protein